jgi:hypothetical protein
MLLINPVLAFTRECWQLLIISIWHALCTENVGNGSLIIFYFEHSLQIYFQFKYTYSLTFPVTQSPVCALVITTVPKSLSAASLVFRIAPCLWLYHSPITKFLGVAKLQAHLQPIKRIILFIGSIKVVASFSVLCFAHSCCCHRALLITVDLFLVLISVLWCSSSVQQVLS